MSDYIEYKVKVYSNGDKFWYVNGQLHREDGPAVEYPNGYKEWWVNGKRHREDGPAIQHSNGYKEWFLNNKNYSAEDFFKEMNEKSGCSGKVVEIDGKKYKLVEA